MKSLIGLTVCFTVLFGFLSEAQIVSASYVVPATKFDPATSYPISDIAVIQGSAGLQSLTFTLPADLVGPSEPAITLTAPTSATNGSWQLSNGLVSASCASDAIASIQCRLDYSADYTLTTNEASVQEYLTQNYGSNPAVLSRKSTAALLFKSDPEGVVTFNLSSH